LAILKHLFDFKAEKIFTLRLICNYLAESF